MALKIKGIIGYDIIGTHFAEQLSRLSGDVNIEIDSPGGSLSDGVSIANAMEDYNKGDIHIRVVGQSSSMAAYCMLFGKTLTFKSNSTSVLHNPWNVCLGDYIEMRKNADILERFSSLYARKFVEKGIFDEPTIRSIMDAETFFIGAEELSRLGNVENYEKDEIPPDREMAIILAKEHMKNCQARLKQLEFNDFERVAALLPSAYLLNTQASSQTNLTNNEINNNVIVQNKKETDIMDLNELQSKHPDIYAQAAKSGSEQEKTRVNALMKFIDIDKDAVVKAINEGKNIQDDEFQSSMLMARIKKEEIKGMEGDNPPGVTAGEPAHAPESEAAAKEQADKEAKEKDEKDLQAVMAHLGYEA